MNRCALPPVRGHVGALTRRGHFGALTRRGHVGALTRRGRFRALTRRGHFGALTRRGRFRALTRRGHCGALARRGHFGALTRRGHCGALARRGHVGALTRRGHFGAFTRGRLEGCTELPVFRRKQCVFAASAERLHRIARFRRCRYLARALPGWSRGRLGRLPPPSVVAPPGRRSRRPAVGRAARRSVALPGVRAHDPACRARPSPTKLRSRGITGVGPSPAHRPGNPPWQTPWRIAMADRAPGAMLAGAG
jgi:hypothetical protein